ncbi:MAG: DUF2993 domain-containing protein [Cyanobacteria bacterium P01_G01_bin.54]
MPFDASAIPDSELIGQILAPALRHWLRSQLDAIDDLQLVIGGKNRQILRGHVPQVFLRAEHAIYQGVHLSKAEMTAQQIRVNLSQVLRGKPLQLLQPVPVRGTVQLSFADLQASLTAPLLAQALTEIMTQLIPADLAQTIADPQWQQIQLIEPAITLTGTLANGQPLSLSGQLTLATPQTLCLDPLNLHLGSTVHALDAFNINLGSDVKFETLVVTAEHLELVGQIQVTPE